MAKYKEKRPSIEIKQYKRGMEDGWSVEYKINDESFHYDCDNEYECLCYIKNNKDKSKLFSTPHPEINVDRGKGQCGICFTELDETKYIIFNEDGTKKDVISEKEFYEKYEKVD